MSAKVAKNKKAKRSARSKFLKELLLAEFETREHKRGAYSSADEKRESDLADQREIDEANHEMEHLLNMVRLFFHMEKLMLFSLLACFDCFLYYFTVFPSRLLYGLLRNQKLKNANKEHRMLALIGLASLILLRVDTSRVYHRIKGQSAVKLYMMFGVLEMGDKMLSSVGQSLMLVANAKKSNNSSRSLRFQSTMLYLSAILYLVCHGFILMYETIALNVAVNSYSNSLLTLLLSMQFAEIKASVFKRFDKEGLFQITISDIMERFQMFILLTIIAIRNLIASSTSLSTLIPDSWSWSSTSSTAVGILCGPIITVVGSEVLVDWIKHAYIIKFNRVRPQMYDTFLRILAWDHTHNLQKLQARLGLPSPALVVLFIVMIKPALDIALLEMSTSMIGSFSIAAMGFVCLLLSKFVLHLLLNKWSQNLEDPGNLHTFLVDESMYVPGIPSSGQGKMDEQARAKLYNFKAGFNGKENALAPPSVVEKRAQHDSKRSLKSVGRYKMVSKRIW
ncbi:LADA_0A05094g1_1 [Lachancea dasiensis]|uniref:LADA_0A05094g1_1 n=1 Tax=Lachancea dasiensis TaxID=1072105 RepID=A0A1G4IPC7_9SACH|nr:LADA_0A05094g1_1 [Lachancea dasiensis]